MPRGGKREGSGRKPKADEVRLAEKLDAILAPDDVWARLSDKVTEGDMNAIKLWIQYRYGMPKQVIEGDVNNSGQLTIIRRVVGG